MCEVTSLREDINHEDVLWSLETEQRMDVFLEFHVETSRSGEHLCEIACLDSLVMLKCSIVL